MNRVIIWDKKNNQDNNFVVIILLIMFNIFKIALGIYYHDLASIYKMGIYYFVYSFLEYIFFKIFKKKKIGNYFLLNALIVSFIVPNRVPIYIFLLGSTLGILIRYLSKDRLSSSVILTLIIYIYLACIGNIDTSIYTGIFRVIYLMLSLFSYILLAGKRIIKRYLPLIIIFLYLIINKGVIDNGIFMIIFMASDTRYNAITKRGEILSIIFLGGMFYLFRDVFYLDYALLLSIFLCEIGVIFINKIRL